MAYIPCLVMQEALLSSRPKPRLLKNFRLDMSQFRTFPKLYFGFLSIYGVSWLIFFGEQ